MNIALLSPYYPYRGGIAQFSEQLTLALEEADLSGACVTGTRLRGLDLRLCRLTGLTAGESLRELRGAIVDPIQAAELARLLGLEIR